MYAMLHTSFKVEAASAESVSKGSGLMPGTPDPGAFVCLVLYTGCVHIISLYFGVQQPRPRGKLVRDPEYR